jgi:hypothetical protein
MILGEGIMALQEGELGDGGLGRDPVPRPVVERREPFGGGLTGD